MNAYVPMRRASKKRRLRKLPSMERKGKKGQVLILRPAFPRKSVSQKKCDLCKKHGGAYTTHSTGECRKYEKDGTLKASFRAAKKGGKKSYPSNQNFTQLTKKIKKLEKALKKSGKRGKKRCYEDSNFDSE